MPLLRVSDWVGEREPCAVQVWLKRWMDGKDGWMDGEDVDVWMDGGSEKVSEVGLLSPGRRRRGCA